MTGLLPEIVREGLDGRSLFEASESFGVVTLLLLVVVLIELEALRMTGRPISETAVLAALAVPLALAVMLTIFLRVTGLLG